MRAVARRPSRWRRPPRHHSRLQTDDKKKWTDDKKKWLPCKTCTRKHLQGAVCPGLSKTCFTC